MARPKGIPKTGGRKAGVPNRANLAARLRIEREADPVGKLIEAVTTGKVKIGDRTIDLEVDQYIGVVRELRKIAIPDAKSATVRLSLPAISKPSDIVEAVGRVVEELSAGNIAPDEASTIADVLDIKRRAIETVELAERIARLENANPGGASR